MKTHDVKNEDLKVGDLVVPWYESASRITAIRPYDGPLRAIMFALVEMEPAPRNGVRGFMAHGMSLERGGYTRVLDEEGKV